MSLSQVSFAVQSTWARPLAAIEVRERGRKEMRVQNGSVKAHVKSGGGDMLGRIALPVFLPSRCEIASQKNLSVLTGL